MENPYSEAAKERKRREKAQKRTLELMMNSTQSGTKSKKKARKGRPKDPERVLRGKKAADNADKNLSSF